MPTGQYPFIDIAVHDEVRDRFAAGDAVVVMSQSLRDVLWVNGPGARLFGHEGIYEFMDAGLDRATASFRQIEAAARSLLDIAERPRQGFVMRTGSGFRRPVVPATMQRIRLSDGNHALLLTAGLAAPATTAEDQAANIIDGFAEMDTHAAVLDAEGNILRATPSFARLSVDAAVRAQIVRDVAAEDDRLVKHPVRTSLGYLPAAIARITDDLHLLIAVEMSIGNLDPAPQGTDARQDPPSETGPAVTPGKVPAPAPSVLNLAQTPDSQGAVKDADPEAPAQPDDAEPAQAEATAADRDPGAAAPQDGFVFNPRKRPVRFVWKIDDRGVFSEISKEFAETVGPNAADIEGRKFTDVAQVFNIDPDHTITDLLRKRDTWSGKTVFWPVQGTDLRVPVDLAALPTYSRDREFDGFRGFGIVRSSDAEGDPERIGLVLVDNPSEPGPFDRVAVESTAEDAEDAGDDEAQDLPPTADDASATAEPEPVEDDPRDAGEKPALDISQSPGRRQSDKVIRLEERRSRPREGLTSAEKLAFSEIAKRLGQDEGDEETEPPAPFGKRTAPPTDQAGEPPLDEASPTDDTASDETPVRNEKADDDGQVDIEPPVFAVDGDADAAVGTSGNDAPPAEDVDAASETPKRAQALTPEILEMLPTPIVVHDGSSIFYINEEFRLLTGYLSTSQLNEAGGLNVLFGGREAANDGGPSVNGSGRLTLHLANARTVSVRARLRSIDWRDGRALMLALSDVSADGEQGQDDAADDDRNALQVEVDELRSILETATDGVVLIGEDGIIRSMNRSAAALFDYDDTDTRGRPFAMLFAHESQRAVQDYLAGLTGAGVASVLNDGREVIGREASGGFLPLFMTIGHLSGSKGYCAVMRDITQWKRAEEELRAAKREAENASSLKSEFLARVSHEIRTPLNAIIGFSELMAEERFGPIGSPRYVEYAHDIGRSGKHVLDIVNDLLDISKIEAGEQELDFQAVSLNRALLDAVSILQPQANSQRVIVRTSLSSSVPDVVADLRSVKQIAINLLSNAIRFTPAGGQVVVSTSYESNGNVSLRIRDTGVGMTRDQLEEAMKPFKQVAGFARERGDGTGLGLPLAKAMAEANRAQFAMNSQPGRGTLVEIIFPSQRVLAE